METQTNAVQTRRHGHQTRTERQRLLAKKPRCTNCSTHLQGMDRIPADYAHVVRGHLSCPVCVVRVAKRFS